MQVLNEAVKLVLSIFVFVLLSADSDTDLSGYVSDTSAPHKSVQAGVNAHVLDHRQRRSNITFVNISA